MTRHDERSMRALALALRNAAGEISEMGCTCASRLRGHQKGCIGAQRAAQYHRTATKTLNRIDALWRDAARRETRLKASAKTVE